LPPTKSKFANSLAICLEVLRRGVLDSKSGAFELDSRLRSTDALERFVFSGSSCCSMPQLKVCPCLHSLRQQVDPHWRQSASQNWSWLNDSGVPQRANITHPVPPKDPQPCFASYRAENSFMTSLVLTYLFHVLPALTSHSFAEMCQAARG